MSFCLGCRTDMDKKLIQSHVDYTRRVFQCPICGIAARFDDETATCLVCQMELTKVVVKLEEDKTTRVYRCEECGMSVRRIFQ